MAAEPALTVGVEEEFLLVDRETGELLQEAPAALLSAFQTALGPQVTTEFLQCQIEVGTKVCRSMTELSDELISLRSAVAAVADEHELALVASSTHPTAGRDAARRTKKERYRVLAEDLQEVVRRLVICGMHIHVGIDDEDLRLDFMSQTTYILPHLLALSTSSPFWRGKDTGLKSYRISVWDEMPRTGLPPNFDSYGEYERHVDVLVQAGVIPDGTMIWWDLRPSWRFPTIESRICDVCTTVEDAVAITALLRCWVHMLWRLRRQNQRWRSYEPMLLNENRWRAQRYGTDEGMIDFGRGSIVGFPALIDEVVELLDEDAEALDCRRELAHLRTILERGTSAHRQLEVYRAAMDGGADDDEAGRAVIDWLRSETVASCR